MALFLVSNMVSSPYQDPRCSNSLAPLWKLYIIKWNWWRAIKTFYLEEYKFKFVNHQKRFVKEILKFFEKFSKKKNWKFSKRFSKGLIWDQYPNWRLMCLIWNFRCESLPLSLLPPTQMSTILTEESLDKLMMTEDISNWLIWWKITILNLMKENTGLMDATVLFLVSFNLRWQFETQKWPILVRKGPF